MVRHCIFIVLKGKIAKKKLKINKTMLSAISNYNHPTIKEKRRSLKKNHQKNIKRKRIMIIKININHSN